MPKVRRNHYQRGREISNSIINSISFNNSQILFSTSSTSTSNPDSTSFVHECDDQSNDSVQVNEISDFQNNNYNSDNGSAHSKLSDELNNFFINVESTNSVDNLPSFKSWLQEWAIKNNITHVALNKLILRIEPQYPDLPRDARSLLGTPRKINVDDVAPGHYYHFGLKNCIETLLTRHSSKNMKLIEININIDGLPLHKSSTSQVYPILCNLVNNFSEVNVIGIYHGFEKPSDANLFLKPFIEEARNLTINGLMINEHTYPFKIRSFICDVPAKSFITYTKGHSGYYACSKCTVRGEYYRDRVIYPYLTSCDSRTDHDFRLKLQQSHHVGTSNLELIPNINMVDDFPSDPMHLIFLGIVKKLVVSLWCFGKPGTKLSHQQVSVISKFLVDQKENVSCDFNRKPRSLSESKRWKATEFRTFLLYTGPIVLKSVLNHDRYLNFLSLHVAITILSNSNHVDKYLDYAKSLLHYFVQTFITLYGKENASHNVHHLLHLCDDVEKMGTLQEFSAFPFENYLQSILKMIRKNNKELEQIVCRITEKNFCANPNLHKKRVEPELLNPHFNGPLINFHDCNQFNKAVFNKFILKTNAPDNCCSLKDGSIIIICNFIANNDGIVIIGTKYKTLSDFYIKPCKSSKLGIHLVENIGNLEFGI